LKEGEGRSLFALDWIYEEMIFQWTIDINQYFVIFMDSDSDSDRGVVCRKDILRF
jgi:hypothetical protein